MADSPNNSPSTGLLQPFHMIGRSQKPEDRRKFAPIEAAPTILSVTRPQWQPKNQRTHLRYSAQRRDQKGAAVTELEQLLAGDGAAAPPAFILEDLSSDLAHRKISHAPRTIYEELWHIAFWQQITLDWIRGIETPYPEHASAGFPTSGDAAREDWDALRTRFFHANRQAAVAASDVARLELPIRCPSRPGTPLPTMTIREQLESLAAHNAYHFGRIVLMRQLLGSWPPPSGGYSW
jgi:uncharacterized damage-inducible protein DinB